MNNSFSSHKNIKWNVQSYITDKTTKEITNGVFRDITGEKKETNDLNAQFSKNLSIFERNYRKNTKVIAECLTKGITAETPK